MILCLDLNDCDSHVALTEQVIQQYGKVSMSDIEKTHPSSQKITPTTIILLSLCITAKYTCKPYCNNLWCLSTLQVDYLVNNAGRSQRAVVTQTSLEVDRAIIELNTIGTISLTKTLLPHMIQQRSGAIVVMSSIAGKLGLCSCSIRRGFNLLENDEHSFCLNLQQLDYIEVMVFHVCMYVCVCTASCPGLYSRSG